MTTKEYLSQAYRIDQRIDSKIRQVQKLRDQSQSANQTIHDSPRTTSPNTHSMESILVNIFDLEREINEDIDALVDLKRDIMHRIKRIENVEYQLILEQRYLCFWRWEQIAVEMDCSTRHLFRIHDAALEFFPLPPEAC